MVKRVVFGFGPPLRGFWSRGEAAEAEAAEDEPYRLN